MSVAWPSLDVAHADVLLLEGGWVRAALKGGSVGVAWILLAVSRTRQNPEESRDPSKF